MSENDLFTDFSPGFFQPVDGTAVQGRGDLQYAVVIVQTAAYIGYGHPFLYGARPGAYICVAHNLRGYQVTHLHTESEKESHITMQIIHLL